MPRRTVTEYLANFNDFGEGTAYVHQRGYRAVRWSYRRVADTAYRTARELEARGIGPGDRVMIWGENCAEWVAVFFACLLRRAVVVPMDEGASPDFAARVAAQVEIRILVHSRGRAIARPGAAALLLEDLEEAVAGRSAEALPPPPAAAEDPVQIVFTSGTTADPKGVVITHRNILANLEPVEIEIRKYLKYARPFRPLGFLNLLPLSHVFGQFLGIFVPQLLRGTVIFSHSLNPTEIIAVTRRERASVIVAVPRMLEGLRDKLERDLQVEGKLETFRRQMDSARGSHFLFRWWRFRAVHRKLGWKFWAFVVGGATLDPEIEQFWGRLGFLVIQGYGLTETTSLISVNHPFRAGKGSIGKVLPGREMRLADDGEILVRGESIASGYWQGSELKPVTADGGWFRTGDVGELDDQGNLYFKGRKKNVLVNREGMNIYPEDLEAALRRQPEVRDCVVIGLDRAGNAEPCAVVLLRSPEVAAEAVVARANQLLAPYQQMRRWSVWPEEDFPRTPTQKVRVAAVKERVELELAGAPATGKDSSALSELVARVTGRPVGEMDPGASLERDLNLGSIDRVELLSALEDRYQVDLSESRFTAATTVGELEQMLRKPAAETSDYRYFRWPVRWPVTWIRRFVYYLAVWPATHLLAHPRITGRERLRAVVGPCLVVSNHITAVDVGFVMAALPGRFRNRLATAMEGELLRAMRFPPAQMAAFRRWIEQLSYWLVTALFNVFPLPKRSGFRRSFQFAGELADNGYSILVFPEGLRTRSGEIAPFQSGIGVLARNLNLPVIPIRIDGLFELKRKGRRWARPGAVTVHVGEPIRFETDAEPQRIAAELQAAVRSA